MSKKHNVNLEQAYEDCCEINTEYPSVSLEELRNEYKKISKYAKQKDIKSVLYNSLFNARHDRNVRNHFISIFHRENDLWIRDQARFQAEQDLIKAKEQIMKSRKHKIKIPKGHEVESVITGNVITDNGQRKETTIQFKPIEKQRISASDINGPDAKREIVKYTKKIKKLRKLSEEMIFHGQRINEIWEPIPELKTEEFIDFEIESGHIFRLNNQVFEFDSILAISGSEKVKIRAKTIEPPIPEFDNAATYTYGDQVMFEDKKYEVRWRNLVSAEISVTGMRPDRNPYAWKLSKN